MYQTTTDQIVRALQEAKYHLWDGTSTYVPDNVSPYICVCLLRVSLDKSLDWSVRNAATVTSLIIRKRLGGAHSVSSWLLANKHAIVDQAFDKPSLQAYRLRWIDSLIAEFSVSSYFDHMLDRPVAGFF